MPAHGEPRAALRRQGDGDVTICFLLHFKKLASFMIHFIYHEFLLVLAFTRLHTDANTIQRMNGSTDYRATARHSHTSYDEFHRFYRYDSGPRILRDAALSMPYLLQY